MRLEVVVGAPVSEVFHDKGRIFHHAGQAAPVTGPIPGRITTRLPGR